jgi:2-oxoglutarate ferredoxin oxidoreductase subunit delta
MRKVVISKEYCIECELCTTACAKQLLKISDEFNNNGYYVVEYCNKEEC